MAEPLVVEISDLRHALGRALDATETLLGPEVALRADYYWHLPVDAAFDVYTEPQALTMGQLSDDLEAVRDPNDGAPENALGTTCCTWSASFERWSWLPEHDVLISACSRITLRGSFR